MSNLGKLISDASGLAGTVGPRPTFRWCAHAVANAPSVLRERKLTPADRGMGEGPFTIRSGDDVRFHVAGANVFSGIREMYVRDVYLGHGRLRIHPGDVVVDLGANMGNFCNLALAHGASRVVAVEPSRKLNKAMWHSLGLNTGFSDRTNLVRAFVGTRASSRADLTRDPAYVDADFLDEDAFLQQTNLDRIDFLKCDIEGGEFALLGRSSRMLQMARKLAIEIHSFGGDVDAFLHMLGELGFELLQVKRDPDGTATALAQRP